MAGISARITVAGKSTTGYSRIPDTSTAGGLLVILQINRQPLVSGVLLALMVVGGLGFWQVERHAAHALLDVQLFRQSRFSRNLGASLLNYIGAYFFTLLAPIYLQVLLGLPVALAGDVVDVTAAGFRSLPIRWRAF